MENSLSQFPYYEDHEFNFHLEGQPLQVCSKPGIPFWNEITPAVSLLAAHVRFKPEDTVLLSGSGHGGLAVFFARQLQKGSLHLLEDNHLALRLSKDTLQKNNIDHVHLHTSPLGSEANSTWHQTTAFDAAVVDLPKGRKLARRKMVEAFSMLKQGGVFYLAGANEEGVQSVIKDAEALFGSTAAIPGYKKGSRAARLVKSTADLLPSWAAEPGIAPHTWHEFWLETDQEKLQLRSLPGVFSHNELDEGTELLLKQLGHIGRQKVLDFGCGSGVIGLLLARRGAQHVDLIDVSLLAVASTRENLRLLQLENACVYPSDVLEAVRDQQYNLIVSNPPFHTGKEVDYQVAETFISHAYHLLTPGGKLVLVANRFIRYDRLMQTYFKRVSTLTQTGKFHVLEAER
jgi:16S rRNA (guanine1207-N2)-methyltransferase